MGAQTVTWLRLAVLADIHGNSWALEAVLADLDRRGVDLVVNLGDSLYGPLDPAATARLLLDRAIPAVRGNEDAVLLEPLADPDHHSSWAFTRASLDERTMAWLARLPQTRVVANEVILCHGTPASDHDYLLEEVTADGVRARRADQVEPLLEGVEQQVVLCGHSHLPHTALLPSGRLVVNPGSVGLPAYTDGLPFPHAMESGSPHARYAILGRSSAGWRVEQVALPYDWGSAALAAAANGRPDWADWLRTGRTAQLSAVRRHGCQGNRDQRR